ncbi:MAG: PHP domain-containing protein [Candidatus Atribacteria bacterium]|nr:PHP domain-containing protein [bacterium]MCG2762213.1 PHP domain-containing protein [Candidatus Atribacteria bacterium]
MKDKIIQEINSKNKKSRLYGLEKIYKLIEIEKKQFKKTEEVNNHLHTIYSFSPYSPSMAAYLAWKAGLQAVGIMDHDSVSGCKELIEACKIIEIASTVGFELRVNFSGTIVEERKLNDPDSKNIGYIAIHGIVESRLPEAKKFLNPIQIARNKRNKKILAKLNNLIKSYRMEEIDFNKEVYKISQAKEGGSITERHILFAFARKIIQKTGKGEKLISFLKDNLDIVLSEKIKKFLLDENNQFYLYDLLGILKSSFLDKIFIQPNYDECISVYEAVKFSNSINTIPAYAYLGDVTDSPTGDKRAEKFEDDFLEELIPELKKIGFKAITYMPPRNTLSQLLRLQGLCKKYELMEISGVDINSPRQSFNYPIILRPEFAHLIEATWALIAHEKLANYDEKYALFNNKNPLNGKSLKERIVIYSEIGRKIDSRHPELIYQKINF